MIPKKIHYCWFGGSDMPPLAKECIKTWKKYLPDYELIRWDETNSPNNEFIKYHLEKRNWAFVSDYVRLYALYKYGGIYLDTDIEVIKPFDKLLIHNAFLGYESEGRVNNGVAGTVKGNEFFEKCMDYVVDNFEKGLPYDISPVVTTNVLANNDYDISILGSEFFYPYNPYDSSTEINILMYSMIKENTYAIHHWAKSWSSDEVINTSTSAIEEKEYLGCGICSYINNMCQFFSKTLMTFVRNFKVKRDNGKMG